MVQIYIYIAPTAGQYELTQGSTAYIALLVPLFHPRKELQIAVGFLPQSGPSVYNCGCLR